MGSYQFLLQRRADFLRRTLRHHSLYTVGEQPVVPERSAEEIQIELTAKLQQYLLPEAS